MIADPLRQLRWAPARCSAATTTPMRIYDASNWGLLQAGFNDMVTRLCPSGSGLRDWSVFPSAGGARHQLGGQGDVAVLMRGRLHAAAATAGVVPAAQLSRVLPVVVETVARRTRYVSLRRRRADTSLEPIHTPTVLVPRLSAADELIPVLGSRHRHCGGEAIADIGAQARFSTVIIAKATRPI